jgi:F-type H+-transporting ATPase subunit b
MNDNSFYENLAIGSQVGGSIVFLVVVVYLWFKYLAPAVAASQARKNAEIEESERRRDAEKSAIETARAEVSSAEADAVSIRERAVREAQAEAERIVAEAKADGERAVQNADGELERGRSAARVRLREEILAKALEIARGAAANVDDATNSRVVGATLDGIDRDGETH